MQPKFSFRKEFVGVIFGVASLVGIAWLINGPMTEAKLTRLIKEQAQALTLMPATEDASITFMDETGTQHSLKEFVGKPLVMNIWATWCPPCVREMPILAQLREKYGDKLNVIAISADQNGFTDIKRFISEHPTGHPPFYHDEGMKLFRYLKIRGLPTTFILNAEGQTVAKMERGIEENDKELLPLLDRLTAEKPPAP